jgi:Flp pilus assembly protein TadB
VVITPLILGAGLGAGVWICVRALQPRPEPIAAILARLEQPGRSGSPGETVGADRSGATGRAGHIARKVVGAVGLAEPPSRMFELADTTPERHAFEKVVASVVGLVVPAVCGFALATAGVRLPVWLVPLLGMTAAGAGWLVPDLALRDKAEQRRRAFRHALSAYLDLVNILLAGGAGIETALYAAADAGDGWGFEKLRHALDRARLTGQSPWDTFARLGESMGISELSELAASVSLAGSHGARIRSSLAAKADALRGRQVAEAESSAEAATERMTIPVTVMLAGFLVFISYPALLEVTSVNS